MCQSYTVIFVIRRGFKFPGGEIVQCSEGQTLRRKPHFSGVYLTTALLTTAIVSHSGSVEVTCKSSWKIIWSLARITCNYWDSLGFTWYCLEHRHHNPLSLPSHGNRLSSIRDPIILNSSFHCVLMTRQQKCVLTLWVFSPFLFYKNS